MCTSGRESGCRRGRRWRRSGACTAATTAAAHGGAVVVANGTGSTSALAARRGHVHLGLAPGQHLDVAGHLLSCSTFAGAHHDVPGDELIASVHLAAALLLENVLPAAARRKEQQRLLKALLDFRRPDALAVGAVGVVGGRHLLGAHGLLLVHLT